MQRMAVSRAEDESNPVDDVPEAGRSQEQALMGIELQRELRRLIHALPRKLRDALLLAGSGEYSYDEIASMLAIPLGTVKWRVSEARRVLRVKLEAKGLFDVR
jgi:RNA polymerase sigma-70 factor (ECF subfamily)